MSTAPTPSTRPVGPTTTKVPAGGSNNDPTASIEAELDDLDKQLDEADRDSNG